MSNQVPGTCYTLLIKLPVRITEHPTAFQHFWHGQSSIRYLLHLPNETACSGHGASNSVSALLACSVKHQVSVTSSSPNCLFRSLNQSAGVHTFLRVKLSPGCLLHLLLVKLRLQLFSHHMPSISTVAVFLFLITVRSQSIRCLFS